MGDHFEPPSKFELVFIWLMVLLMMLLIGGTVATQEADAKGRCATATQAIKCYWPAHSRWYALRVAECESTASAPERIARRRGLGRWARNGQYVGIFQMGVHERRRYGWYRKGAPARVQVLSARRLYWHRGWQPWACA